MTWLRILVVNFGTSLNTECSTLLPVLELYDYSDFYQFFFDKNWNWFRNGQTEAFQSLRTFRNPGYLRHFYRLGKKFFHSKTKISFEESILSESVFYLFSPTIIGTANAIKESLYSCLFFRDSPSYTYARSGNSKEKFKRKYFVSESRIMNSGTT